MLKNIYVNHLQLIFSFVSLLKGIADFAQMVGYLVNQVYYHYKPSYESNFYKTPMEWFLTSIFQSISKAVKTYFGFCFAYDWFLVLKQTKTDLIYILISSE